MNSMDEGMFEPWPGIDLATVPISVEQPHGFIVIGRPERTFQFRLMGLKIFHQNLKVAEVEQAQISEQLPGWEIVILECQIPKAA